MANFWRQHGLPHKGCPLVDAIDVRENDQAEWETDYKTCMMCRNEKIRYVHIVEHAEVGEKFRVGCTCAEKMTSDYLRSHERRERELRNRANRRTKLDKKRLEKEQ